MILYVQYTYIVHSRSRYIKKVRSGMADRHVGIVGKGN